VQVKPPVALVSRAAPTAQVIASPGSSPKKGKVRSAAKPHAEKLSDPWSFEEAYCVKPTPAKAPPRAAEPAVAPESPLAVFEMVRNRRSPGTAEAHLGTCSRADAPVSRTGTRRCDGALARRGQHASAGLRLRCEQRRACIALSALPLAPPAPTRRRLRR
jgi:hypothetical protein